MHFIKPHYYNGTLQDSNEVGIQIFKTLYSGIYGCWFSTSSNNMDTPQNVFNEIDQSANNLLPSNPIPIISMLFEYQKLRNDAYNLGIVYMVNGQIFEGSGNPYDKKVLFAACPLKTYFKQQTLTFSFANQPAYSNYQYSVVAIKADMGDGNGLNTVSGTYTATYSEPGIKHFTVEYAFSNGIILKSHGNFIVDFETINTFKSGEIYDDYFQDKKPISANSNHSGGTLFIRYGKGNEDKVIRKPFVVVEGYDVSYFFPEENLGIEHILEEKL